MVYHKTGNYVEQEIKITDELKAKGGFTWEVIGTPKIQIEVKMTIDGKGYSRFFFMPCDMSKEECESFILGLSQFANSIVK